MKKAIVLLTGLMMIVWSPTPAQAKVMYQEEGEVKVAEGQVIEDDLYIGGETVEIDGVVKGDVYIAGGVVEIDGEVTGDLVVGAGEVRIKGKVGDDLWIGAGNVSLLEAQIGDGANIGAGTVYIDEKSSIGGSLLVGAGTVTNESPVKRNLMAGAGQLKQNGTVGKEMRAAGEKLELGEKTVIEGNLTYVSEGELVKAEGARIGGVTKRIESSQDSRVIKKDWQEKARKNWVGLAAGMNVLSYLGALLVGGIMLWLLKKPSLQTAEKIEQNLLSSLGWGLLTTVLAGPAVILLLITGVGAPLAMISMMLLLVDFYLAKIVASLALGKVLTKQFGWKKMQIGWSYALGLSVYYILRMIPLVGIFARIGMFFAGVGAIMLQLKEVKK